nr:Sul2 [Starmerella bombicola]
MAFELRADAPAESVSNTPQYEASPKYNSDVNYEYTQPLPSIADPVKWYFTGFKQRVITYLISLFPICQWIYRYNLRWLYGDVVAGITVGIVVVPQGMSYAQVAGLPVQYGLYSSFIGVMLYCFFATSKDVSIGPVAVMSSETYKITHKVLKDVPGLTEKDLPVIAGVLSLLCGAITLGLGILRLGFILEYIPMPAVLGFMTGSAFTIAAGQVPNMLGTNKLLDTRAASYLVVINTLKTLPHANVNAAFGFVSLFMLYFLRWVCGYLEKKDKKRKWLWFYLGTLRAALVIIFTTLISWGCYRIYGKTKISMIGTVPRGLKDVGVHPVDRRIASSLGSELPIATVILVLEHIAIGKSFGRINEYRINPNQELIAIGISNMIGHFFQAYPNTGSFSRTALKSKCGVRTPLAGILTGACVLVAIYALTDAFYYISQAALAAIIIHAVGDLVASYKATMKFYKVNPIEFLIFLVDVILCVFVTLEAGIYFSVAASLVNLLLKQTFPLGEFMGKVTFTRKIVNLPQDNEEEESLEKDFIEGQPKARLGAKQIEALRAYKKRVGTLFHKRAEANKVTDGAKPSDNWDKKQFDQTAHSIAGSADTSRSYNGDSEDQVEVLEDAVLPSGLGEPGKELTVQLEHPGQIQTKWWPLSHNGIHPGIEIVPPPPGILVYRFRESLTYQNVSWQVDRIVDHVRKHTKRNLDLSYYKNQKLGDRPWNEPGPRKYVPPTEEDTRPLLRAIIFDMSCSPNVDLSGAQGLWDCHQEVTKYACGPVEFHFAGILSPWSRRALVNCGFGGHKAVQPPQTNRLVELGRAARGDLEAQDTHDSYVPVIDTHNCYFHFEIPDLEFSSFQ